MSYDSCPLCGRNDALGDPWVHRHSGELLRTCFGLNRPEHLGRKHNFYVENGEPLHHSPSISTGPQAALQRGRKLLVPIRGIHPVFLSKQCLVSSINHQDLSLAFPDNKTLYRWAYDCIQLGLVITMLPIVRGLDITGIQLRAFDPRTGENPTIKNTIQAIGEADGLYLPAFIGWHPSAIVIHEGPWGAIVNHHEGQEYGSQEVFPVAVISASARPETIRRTLDLIFPGVPRFSVFDQDYAGIKLREKTQHIAKPVTISGAGQGKDYRDLIPGYRFERLSEIIRAELKVLDGAK